MNNMRQIIKRGKPSLRMADGGGMAALDTANYFSGLANKDAHSIAAPQIGGQPIQMADGGMFSALKRVVGITPDSPELAAYKAQAAAARAPQPTMTPAVPQPQVAAPMGSQSVLDGRMKAAGLRHGGDLQTGQGGNVPGIGQGDKIPAKYEPGEFVVSNAMLDAQPELRLHLASLRNHVLQAEGKDPAAVDAHQMHKAGLRADDGFVPPENAPTAAPATPVPGSSSMGQKALDLGGKVRGVMNSPTGQTLRKAGNAFSNLNALRLATDSGEAADQGNYADAADKGALAVASTSAAGLPGLAYGAGHMVGTHLINPNLSDDTKTMIGGVINQGLRNTGDLFGQKWGVDDDALMANSPPKAAVNASSLPSMSSMSTPAATPKAAAPAASVAALAEPTGNVNVTRQANGNLSFSGKDVTGTPTYTGDAAKSLRTGGAGVTSMPASAFTSSGFNPGSGEALQAARMAAVQRGESVAPNGGNDDGMAGLRAHAMDTNAIGHNGAARLLGTLMGDKTTQRGQDLGYDSAMAGHNMTRNSNIARLRYDMDKDNRDYQRNVANDNFTQGETAQKALHEEISSYIPPGADGKPDVARAAQMMSGLNAHVAGRIGDLQKHLQLNPGDKTAAAELQGLQTRGVAQMGPDAKRKFITGQMASDVASNTTTGFLNPVGTTSVESAAPIKSLRRKETLFGHDYVSDRGDVIPGRYIDRSDATMGIGGRRNRNFEDLIQK